MGVRGLMSLCRFAAPMVVRARALTGGMLASSDCAQSTGTASVVQEDCT